MLFPTLTFHVFFLVVFALAWAMRKAGEWRLIMLLVASWIFYGAWDWRFVGLLQLSALINWYFSHLIVRFEDRAGRRKAALLVGVALNLAILAGLGWERDIPIIDVILPVGISFFTFQGMSYLIDTYRGTTKPASLLELTVLMSFFPHLVAGPIVRPSHILPQLRVPPRLTRGIAATCVVLILWGVIKKAVIANELSIHLVDPVFADPLGHSSLDLLVAAYGYAVQIYCDFSAYSDMAVGLAGLLGFRFPRNFDQPYRAASLQDFWRRWHISLSSWLRDYLYIGALGGSRHGRVRTYLALLATMVLGGLWHGASWNFVIWGALHGGVLALERFWREFRPVSVPALPGWLGVIVTFHIVTVGWIFFRSAEFATAQAYLGRLWFAEGGATLAAPWTVLLIVLGLACHFGPRDAIQWLGLRLRGWPALAVAAGGAAVLIVVEGFRGAGVAPFIYFQF